MRVLHLLNTNKYSGAENVVCTIIKNMEKDYEMVYCSPEGPIEDKLLDEKINYLPLKKLSISEVRKALNIFKPDIIHAHDNRATVIASFFSNKYKIVSHIHGNNTIMNNKNLKTIIFNYCSKKIDKFIWVSDSSLSDYIYKNNIINKSLVLYNVIDNKKIHELSSLYSVEEKYDLIYLGRLGYPKNPERFINLVKALKEKNNNIRVAMVGDGVDKSKIENLIKEYQLDNNIKMFGFQTNPYPILRSSKILVMTSLYEGTPMCALEAQSFGIPIIATPVDGLKKIIKNNYNGFLSDNNDELKNVILQLLNNRKMYDGYSVNSHNSFKEINDLKKYCDVISSIYKGD